MNSDNYERPRIAHKNQRTTGEEAGNSGGFETRKIKKEKSDVCGGNGTHVKTNTVDVSNSVVVGESTNNDGNASQRDHHRQQQQQQQHRSNINSRLSNGFHASDLLQDIVAAKITSNPHGLGSSAKNDNIRLMIEDSISDESKSRVQEIFLLVEQLKIEEKLLLYLKLPSSLTNPNGTVDPLRQPLNPLGNRYEIHQTIMWIKTHLEEDPDVSLPKQEVYDEYNIFCIRNSMKPLSTADFGKVMKQVYPRVRPRRLGTRGNSRYCYAGMRKRVKLHTPTLPSITGTPAGDDLEEHITEEMLGAASTLIREWAESTLGHKFPTLSALAHHLVENLCVDTRSLSAVCILSAFENISTYSKETSPSISVTQVGSKPGKLREAQLQLQKKLQQREQGRDQKHRHSDITPATANHGNKDINKNSINNGRGSSMGRGLKKSKTGSSSQVTTSSTSTNTNKSSITSERSRKLSKSVSQSSTVSPQSVCDGMTTRTSDEPHNNELPLRSCTPNDSVASRDTKESSKNSRKRASLDQTHNNSETSPEKQAKLAETPDLIKKEDSQLPISKLPSIPRSAKISVIPPANLKAVKIDDNLLTRASEKRQTSSSEIKEKSNGYSNVSELNIATTQTNDSSILTKDQLRILQEDSTFLDKNEKLCTIDADALDDYLNGGNNSQEPEEELLQYFQHSSSSSSDAEVNPALSIDMDHASRSDKVSQLRLILQQNLKGTVRPVTGTVATNTHHIASADKRSEMSMKHEIISPVVNHQNQNSSRRRVSFETNVIEHIQEISVNSVNTVPQSPNTRRRIFNFTPISPGSLSPINGRAASKPNSANASPFVSPRNTPVPRSRSNMASVCRSRSGQKQFSRSISCSAPFIGKNDTFVVPTSCNETTKQASSNLSPLARPKSTAEVQVGGTVRLVSEKTLACTSFLANDVNPQKQLLINYPSQENLQEIRNVYRKNQPTDQEISELFNSVKPFTTTDHYYRSQSVPLHRMVNPTLMSPVSNPQSYRTFQNNSFNHSSSSSIAPTPVPSEFNDFGSIGQSDTYLLDEVDANFINEDQQFLMEDKEISSENITKILNFLDEEDEKGLNILPEQNIHADERLIHESSLMLDPLPDANLNIAETISLNPATVLDPSVGESLQKIIQSKSYPNTPLPQTTTGYSSAFTEDSNGSRSYPSTPLHPLQHQDVYCESNEPMLSSPTLNSLNLRTDRTNPDTESVCRNVTDLLDTNFLAENEGDPNSLDPLSNFDGLQDVDSLAPLFNEVTDGNR